MSHDNNTSYGTVSPQLDELTSTLMGDALDVLATRGKLNVLLVIQMQDGTVESLEYADDGAERLLTAARDHVRSTRHALRYAIAYEGAVDAEDETFADALIVEFGERGCPSYSAFSLFEGRGKEEAFRWTDPAPAGEEEPLLMGTM